MDLYEARVEDRNAQTVRLRLHIKSLDCVDFPVSRRFALMLLTEGPGKKRFSAWMNAQDEELDYAHCVVSVELLEVRNLPREQGKPPAGMTRDDSDEKRKEDPGILGEALLAITVDAPGMLDHWDVGMTWGSTAFDEGYKGPVYDGRLNLAREWRRDPG